MKRDIIHRIFIFIIFLSQIYIPCYSIEPIRVLAIGNSFSADAVEEYLDDIAIADNTALIIGNMFVPGCTLEQHWNFARNDSAIYSYRKIDVNGIKHTKTCKKLIDGIMDEEWDYITFQQASKFSGLYNTYFPYINNLLEYVKSNVKNTDVKYAIHMTWAYEKDSAHDGFINYNNDQSQMYNAIIETVYHVAKDTGIHIIIPVGTAIQNGRNSDIQENFCRDGFHLSTFGKYIAACTWYDKLLGKVIIDNSFVPTGIEPSKCKLAQIMAQKAIIYPYGISSIR